MLYGHNFANALSQGLALDLTSEGSTQTSILFPSSEFSGDDAFELWLDLGYHLYRAKTTKHSTSVAKTPRVIFSPVFSELFEGPVFSDFLLFV